MFTYLQGETVFVSGGAGAVGQMVIALCHREGAKVIASAGSDEKVEFLKNELKVEYAFNYKKTDTLSFLKEHPFQAYWDNVGGDTLDAVLATIDTRGRLAECGMIANYNEAGAGIKNLMQVVAKSLKMQG